MDWIEVALRLGAAALLGIAIGLNRYIKHNFIGVRTLGLVALSAAAIVAAVSDALGPDSAGRALQGVLTGIGFLGAGVIMRDETKHKVHGLTTAAAVWLSAVVGCLCGLGAVRWTIAVAIIGGLILVFGGPFEQWICRRFKVSDGLPGAVDAAHKAGKSVDE